MIQCCRELVKIKDADELHNTLYKTAFRPKKIISQLNETKNGDHDAKTEINQNCDEVGSNHQDDEYNEDEIIPRKRKYEHAKFLWSTRSNSTASIYNRAFTNYARNNNIL